MTVVVAGHSPRAIQNADRIIVISEGKVVRDGSAKDLISSVEGCEEEHKEIGEVNEKSFGY